MQDYVREQPLTSPAEELFHDGHEGGHLTEDEYPMAHGLELDQHAIQHLKLPWPTNQLNSATGRLHDINEH